MKKRWYRVVLDVAYEGEHVLDKDSEPVKDPEREQEILTRVVKRDFATALHTMPAGPVDLEVVRVYPREDSINVFMQGTSGEYVIDCHRNESRVTLRDPDGNVKVLTGDLAKLVAKELLSLTTTCAIVDGRAKPES